MTLPSACSLDVLLQWNTPLFPLLLLYSFSLALNAAKFPIHFRRVKHQPQSWRFAEVEEAVSERLKAFSAARKSDKDRLAYISNFRHASPVIAKAKAEAY